ncbi:hypothetical protein [Bacillus cereus]|uniref:Uncharacterized protein n=1 Tax=Bacillus cereus TaxID=1396 RepID=A0A2B1KUM6_BACCE|nr:hypothetical protein [Bacillus cereus]PFN28590.1 hypothetical protein COJ50_04975 [Bacillus cereus]
MGKLSDKYLNPQEQPVNEMNAISGVNLNWVPTIGHVQGKSKRCQCCGGTYVQGEKWVKQKKQHNNQLFYGAEFALHVCSGCYRKQKVYK